MGGEDSCCGGLGEKVMALNSKMVQRIACGRYNSWLVGYCCVSRSLAERRGNSQ